MIEYKYIYIHLLFTVDGRFAWQIEGRVSENNADEKLIAGIGSYNDTKRGDGGNESKTRGVKEK